MSDTAVDQVTASRVSRRRLLWLLPVAAVVLGAFAVAQVLRGSSPDAFYIWMVDFGVYRAAGRAVLDGLPLYDMKVGQGVLPNAMPFTYTPFAAVLFTVLAMLGAVPAQVLWTIGNVLALAAVIWLSLDMAGVSSPRRRVAVTAVGAVVANLLDPVYMNLAFGQINLFVLLLVLVDFTGVVPARWRGIALGVAAGIKLIPLIFVAYLVCTGRRRTAAVAAGTFAGTIVLGVAVLGRSAWRYWSEGVFLDVPRILISPVGVNHSLFGLFARLSGGMVAPGWALAAGALAGAFGLAAATVAYWRGHELLGVVVVGVTSMLVSPVTWPPHGVWIVPALVWLWFAAWRTRSVWPRVCFAVVALWFMLPVYWPAMRLAGTVPYQLTLPGGLLASLGGPLPVLVLGLASLPWWLPRLIPPRRAERPAP